MNKLREFVESLKRLFESQKVDESRIHILFNGKKITEDEMNYILSK